MLSQNKRFNSKAYCLRFSATLLLTSLVAGVGGILLHDLLELVEWMIFGHGEVQARYLSQTYNLLSSY